MTARPPSPRRDATTEPHSTTSEVVAEADWIEQHQPVLPESADEGLADLPTGVPEPDWIDQHRVVDPDVPSEMSELPPGVPEADALEQSQTVPLDDEVFAHEEEHGELS
ncbi:MAG TPA: hypothetical protein VFW97_19520 [Acidimicrobiia bacterium]|jgi:hypothetical protein|nr:hypothetical protein [Acidimicrobiia bacterium]